MGKGCESNEFAACKVKTDGWHNHLGGWGQSRTCGSSATSGGPEVYE